jgi:hypothetical protein
MRFSFASLKLAFGQLRIFAERYREKSEYLADGFESQEDLFKGLQKYYPNITMDSPVTVIKWDNVQGYWIENREVYRDNVREEKLYKS